MVIAYHLVWVAYGWWLPNDPRGSMSTSIRCDVLKELGELHHGRKRVQPASRDLREFYDGAKELLKHPLLTCAPKEMDAIAEAFATVMARERYTCYACAVLPDHVHLVIRKHRDLAEQMIRKLQWESAEHVRRLGLRDDDHPVWGGPGWKVFLDSPHDIRRTIPYVENNPIKMRLPRQTFPFVVPYDNWPLHRR
jgi:REP element-mobilizing transposase RayT